MSTPLAEAFVRISLDQKYLEAQIEQSKRLLDAFASARVQKTMTPQEQYAAGLSSVVRDALTGTVSLNDGIARLVQLEKAATDQARVLAQQLRSAHATPEDKFADQFMQVKTLQRGGFLNTADADRMIQNLTAAWQRANAAADPYAATQSRINGFIEQGTPTVQRLAAAEHQLINEMNTLGVSAEKQQLALQGLRASFGIAGDSGRRMNSILMQASFGVQDFITVLSGGGGLQMALMSAANNFAQMAAIAGSAAAPGSALAVAAPWVGVGVTLAAIVIPRLFETKKETDKLKESIDSLAEAFKHAESSAAAMVQKLEVRDRFEGLLGEGASSKTLEDEQKRLSREERGKTQEIGDKEQELANYRQQVAERRAARDHRRATEWAFTDDTVEEREKRFKEDAEIQKRENEIRQNRRQRSTIRSDRKELVGEQISAQERELEKGNRAHAKRRENAVANFRREQTEITRDLNDYEGQRAAIRDKHEQRARSISENGFISDEEKRNAIAQAEIARDQDLKKVDEAEQRKKRQDATETERRDRQLRMMEVEAGGNPEAIRRERIQQRFEEQMEQLEDNKALSQAERDRLGKVLAKGRDRELANTGFRQQQVGLQALHSEIQRSLQKSYSEDSAKQTANNTNKLVTSNERTAKAVEKIAENQGNQVAVFA